MSPYDLGKNITVEDCPRVSIYDCLRDLGIKSKEVALQLILDVLGVRVNLTTTNTQFNGLRLWFLCPHCERRIKILLLNPLTYKAGCRHCLGVIYRDQRFKLLY